MSDTVPSAAPWYLPVADEVTLFEAAWRARLPVLLEGPTGCGKTRFVEHMAWRQFHRDATHLLDTPLITVACHEDLTATDLVGRYLLVNNQTVWSDGPLTRAVRHGAICYLDEVVEARKDTTVVIHSLTDHRRLLPIEKTGELLAAHPNFLLVISYNPGYQSALKDLKPSTRQRFVTLPFGYPPLQAEATVIAHEGGVDCARAALALLGSKCASSRATAQRAPWAHGCWSMPRNWWRRASHRGARSKPRSRARWLASPSCSRPSPNWPT
jgi:nitric oxide reductase NorQ protein